MKTIALQDNLSKVKAVEELYQQMLRFPDDLQKALAGELEKQRRLRRRKIARSQKSDDGKLNTKQESKISEQVESKGRKENHSEQTEIEKRQCCIDFRV